MCLQNVQNRTCVHKKIRPHVRPTVSQLGRRIVLPWLDSPNLDLTPYTEFTSSVQVCMNGGGTGHRRLRPTPMFVSTCPNCQVQVCMEPVTVWLVREGRVGTRKEGTYVRVLCFTMSCIMGHGDIGTWQIHNLRVRRAAFHLLRLTNVSIQV